MPGTMEEDENTYVFSYHSLTNAVYYFLLRDESPLT